jgi:hypothetical protein
MRQSSQKGNHDGAGRNYDNHYNAVHDGICHDGCQIAKMSNVARHQA